MCLNKFLSTDSFHDNLLMGIEICGEQTLKLIVCEDGFVNKRFLYFFDVIGCRFCDFSLGNIILDIEIITAESLDLRDKKDGTYTALPGATLYELYGENWREESGYVGNPSNLQVGETVGRQILSGNKSDIMIKNEEQVDKNLQYLSNENEKALIQIPITGLRGALGLGGGISLQVFYNPNDIWDSGLSLTTMAGIGIDIGIETPLSFISEKILNTVANNISTSSPTSSNDIVGIRTGASSGAFLGINYDIEEKNLSGDIGNIGGGVYTTSTKVVTLKNVADYFREFVWWK